MDQIDPKQVVPRQVWHERRIHSDWIRKQRVKRDIKVTLTVALTIASFLLSWTPYAVVSLCESFFDIDVYSISWLLVQLPCLMAKTACMWNPLVYVCHHGDFNKAFVDIFKRLKSRCIHQVPVKNDQKTNHLELQSVDNARSSTSL